MQCCRVCTIFSSLWSRNDCVVNCWKLRSFRITGGSLSMKYWSMLCLRGFYTGFHLRQRWGEVLSFACKSCGELRSWMAPKRDPAPLLLLSSGFTPWWLQKQLLKVSDASQQQLLCSAVSGVFALLCLLQEALEHHSCPQTAARSWGAFQVSACLGFGN